MESGSERGAANGQRGVNEELRKMKGLEIRLGSIDSDGFGWTLDRAEFDQDGNCERRSGERCGAFDFEAAVLDVFAGVVGMLLPGAVGCLTAFVEGDDAKCFQTTMGRRRQPGRQEDQGQDGFPNPHLPEDTGECCSAQTKRER
jgi:hypothetical protein